MPSKSKDTKLDDIDKRILNALIENGQIGFAQLGQLVGLSGPGVHDRVKKLKEQGVIERISAVVNPRILDRNFLCFVQLKLDGVDKAGKAAKLQEIKEIEEIHNIAGEFSLLCKIRATDTDHMERVFSRIYSIEGIIQSVTTVVFGTFVDRPISLDIGQIQASD